MGTWCAYVSLEVIAPKLEFMLVNFFAFQVSGELGLEMAQHADKFISGVISNVESSYSKFEQVLTKTLRMPITRKRQPARRAKLVALNNVKKGAAAKPAALNTVKKGAVAKPASKRRRSLLW